MNPIFGIDDTPKEIREAAQMVSDYFTEQGIDRWEFMGLCSRNLAVYSCVGPHMTPKPFAIKT